MSADAGGDRGDAGDRPRRAGDDAVARRDLRPGRLHGRHRRPLHDQLRLDDVVRDPGVAARQLHADADAGGALDQDEAAPRGRRRPRRSTDHDVEGRALLRALDAATRDAALVAGAPRDRRGHRGARAARAACRCSWSRTRTSCRTTTSRSSRSACARRRARASRRPRSSPTASPAGSARCRRSATRSSRSPTIRRRRRTSATIYVRLKPIDERERDQFDLMERGRARDAAGGWRAEPAHRRPAVATIGGGGQNAEIQFTINGPDLSKCSSSTPTRRERRREGAGRRRPRHVAERRQAGALGRTSIGRRRRTSACRSSDAADALRLLVGGDQVTTYNEGGEQYEVHVRARRGNRRRRRRSAADRCRRTGRQRAARQHRDADAGHGAVGDQPPQPSAPGDGLRRTAARASRRCRRWTRCARGRVAEHGAGLRTRFAGRSRELGRAAQNFLIRVRALARVHVSDPGGAVRVVAAPGHDPAVAAADAAVRAAVDHHHRPVAEHLLGAGPAGAVRRREEELDPADRSRQPAA